MPTDFAHWNILEDERFIKMLPQIIESGGKTPETTANPIPSNGTSPPATNTPAPTPAANPLVGNWSGSVTIGGQRIEGDAKNRPIAVSVRDGGGTVIQRKITDPDNRSAVLFSGSGTLMGTSVTATLSSSVAGFQSTRDAITVRFDAVRPDSLSGTLEEVWRNPDTGFVERRQGRFDLRRTDESATGTVAVPGATPSQDLYGRWRSQANRSMTMEFMANGSYIVTPSSDPMDVRRGTFSAVAPNRIRTILEVSQKGAFLGHEQRYDDIVDFRINGNLLSILDAKTQRPSSSWVKEESYAPVVANVPARFEIQDKGSAIPRREALAFRVSNGNSLLGYSDLASVTGADEILYKYGRAAANADRSTGFGQEYKVIQYYSQDDFGTRVWLVLTFINAARDQNDPNPSWNVYRLVNREFVPIR